MSVYGTPIAQDSPAVAVARSHAEVWSNHDWDTARAGLAEDVRVTATTTEPTLPATDLRGVDDYMRGLIEFAQAVEPGSARVIASIGDERNALLMLTVEANLGGRPVTLPAARLYLLDEDDKIKSEQIVYSRPRADERAGAEELRDGAGRWNRQ
jgi:hypothetical protein